jgi:phosphatidylserine decarboxylase
MPDMILDARTLPEPLFRLVDTDKVRVRKVDDVITMSPVKEVENVIDKLYGSWMGKTNLTVDKFLEMTREDKGLED